LSLKSILLFLLLLICSDVKSHDIVFNKCKVEDGVELCSVSILDLIVHPQQFNGKIVKVNGYYQKNWEESGLYLSKDSAESIAGENGIWINKNCTKKCPEMDFFRNDSGLEKWRERLAPGAEANSYYSQVVGLFDADSKGHLGLYNGTINGVIGFDIIDRTYAEEKTKKQEAERNSRIEQIRKNRESRNNK